MLIKNDPNRIPELDLRILLDPTFESQFAEIVEMVFTICVNGLLDPRSTKNLKVADPVAAKYFGSGSRSENVLCFRTLLTYACGDRRRNKLIVYK
jgi:hypothetical protein